MHRQSMQSHAPFVTLLLAMSSFSGKSTKLESCYVVPSHLLYSRPNCHFNHARPESSCLENPNQIETQCCNAPFNSHSYCTRAPNNQHRFHYQSHQPESLSRATTAFTLFPPCCPHTTASTLSPPCRPHSSTCAFEHRHHTFILSYNHPLQRRS